MSTRRMWVFLFLFFLLVVSYLLVVPGMDLVPRSLFYTEYFIVTF